MSKQENNPPEDSEDNFGLPDIDFKPLNRDVEPVEKPAEVEEVVPVPVAPVELQVKQADPVKPKPVEPELPSLPPEFDDEEKQRSPVIVGVIVAGLILAAASLTYFFIYKPKADKVEAEKIAKAKIDESKLKAKEDSLARINEEQKKLLAQSKEVAVKPVIGEIETLTERTQRYYVIISSNIDDDLIMDYAKKLSEKGISTKIIPPFGKAKYYRLSISNEESFAKAQTDADAAKAEYGNALWVMKY